MKHSIFNSRISISDNSDLIYNAFTNKFVIIRRHINILDNDNVDKFKNFGFIVDDDFDELENIISLSKYIDNKNDYYHIIINPTLSCNFNCWYCYEEKSNKSRMTFDTLNRIKKFITYISTKNVDIAISFFGGEPLLMFENIIKSVIDHTCSECNKKNCKYTISFTSNGYLINENIVNYLKDKRVINFQITLDGSRELHDKTRHNKNSGSYDIILNNIKLLVSNNINVTVRINYTDANLHTLNKIADDFISKFTLDSLKNIIFSFHQVWQNKNINLNYEINEVINYFNKKGMFTRIPIFDNVRNSCYGDKRNSVIINYNGDLFKCTAIDFINHKRDGYINEEGMLIWENNSLNNRLNSKFKNKPCLSCRILPICNGGCSQKALEYSNTDYCILNFDEKEKDEVILNKFIEILKKENNIINKIL